MTVKDQPFLAHRSLFSNYQHTLLLVESSTSKRMRKIIEVYIVLNLGKKVRQIGVDLIEQIHS